MKKEKDQLFNKKIQDALNVLISEETIANNFYIGCIVATDKDNAGIFEKMFIDIAADELDDHCQKLVKYAVDNDYDVPFKFKDYEKYANKKIVRQFNSLKSGKNAKYYVEEAIKSEQFAIDTYQKFIEDQDLPYEFTSILYQNMYDEKDHLEKLNILIDATENNAQLIGF